ncbi:MAG: stress response translation initiation inhibitor YciH [Actinomycetota bacterium]
MGSIDRFDNARRVYSTDTGRVREERPAAPEPPRGDGVVRVSRTKAGRKGKTVTLVTGLPPGDLEGVARELKRLCGSGGAVKDGVVEVQGDHRDRVAAHLGGRYRVKLAGG